MQQKHFGYHWQSWTAKKCLKTIMPSSPKWWGCKAYRKKTCLLSTLCILFIEIAYYLFKFVQIIVPKWSKIT